ncbi:Sec-independent protein translocase protein TatB [Sphingomonas rubra]|uniref:Sec-independent protein translocase protein TatB n=1 Tax=Sphingomonas rubra TaxID=634430 RepID=A0A1I5PKR1_9SPHN|nr:Sec-independent protein translocase protein TatB [Sphingomonas rubra]SFP34447.1 sec-independent protein translocase protein TatB [Sphingomonas rubra]
MFGVDSSEFLLIALVALVVIGPKDLPKAMRVVGYWVGRARGVARQFRSGFDAMVREAELEEMEKKWAAENERIMREHPQPTADAAPYGDAAATAPEMTEAEKAVTVERPEVAPAADDEAARPAGRTEGASS